MAFIDAAQLTAAEIDTVKIHIRRDQNLVVVSTPEPEVAVRVQELPAITINGCQYEILAYSALPDNSCRGVITGLDSKPTSEILSTRIRAQGVKVLCARMMGQTNTAIINFEGLKVPYYEYFRGAEYRCGKPGTADQEHNCNEKCVNCGQPPAVQAAELSDPSEPASKVRLTEPHLFKPTPSLTPPPSTPPEPSPTSKCELTPIKAQATSAQTLEKLREESNAKLKALQAEMMGELDRRVCELAKVIHNDVQAQMRSFAEEIISQQESRFQQIIQPLIQPLTKQVAELTVQLRQIAQSRIMAPIPNESVVEITSNTAPTPTTVNTKILPNPLTQEPPYTPQI
ncbi:hypothetical protein HPB47_022262 [Ixodes persulcatus]|uniref:Uncharacterized protein n=1 Tax=Ixodes persulcatus TaxID=34615 RepID=A0AC60QCJ8_IXOPE|nr:hypothetical protein HPB47_022262 [Ixodes persulcatus]